MIATRLMAIGIAVVFATVGEAIATTENPLAENQSNINDDDHEVADYAYHAACGSSIVNATGDYCSNKTYLARLNHCLSCAAAGHIWNDYGPSAQAAASKCGLTATPGSTVEMPRTTTTQQPSPPNAATITVWEESLTSVSHCQPTSTVFHCVGGGAEWEIPAGDRSSNGAPTGFGDCHSLDADTLRCVNASGARVTLRRIGHLSTGASADDAAAAAPTAAAAAGAVIVTYRCFPASLFALLAPLLV